MISSFILPLTVVATPLMPSRDLSEEVPQNLDSISFVAKIQSGNQSELRKISEDFGKSYRFDHANVDIQVPFKIRVESVVDGQSVIETGNGDLMEFRVPRAGIHSKQNIRTQPGRRQTFLDFGLIAPGFNHFFDSRFVRVDRATHDDVYDLTYGGAGSEDTSRFRIWFNPTRKLVDRKEWYGQKGQLRATFFYLNPVELDHIWVPTELQVRNAEDRLAGVMKFQKIRVNPSLSSSLFKI